MSKEMELERKKLKEEFNKELSKWRNTYMREAGKAEESYTIKIFKAKTDKERKDAIEESRMEIERLTSEYYKSIEDAKKKYLQRLKELF